MKKFLYVLLLLFSLAYGKAFSQKNYFYSSVKIPLGDYIIYVITKNNNTDPDRNDGALFDFGYGININENFIVEAGVEAFFYNPLYRKNYNNSDRNSGYTELSIINQAFAFQLRSVFKIDIDEETKFRLGCAVNFQQLFSRGNFFVKNDGQSSTSISNLQSSAKSKTSFGNRFSASNWNRFYVNR